MAVVGVGLGYLARGDSAQAVNGGLVMLMSHVRRPLVPDRRQLAAWLQSLAARHADVLDHPDRPGAAHPRVAGDRRLGRAAAWALVGRRGSRRARYRADDLRAA